MAFFTSISSNYLPKALILANSVRRHRPEAPFYVVLCDKPPAELPRFGWAFSKVFLLEDLRLPVEDVEQWVFKHTVVELCTAVKAPFMVQAMEELQIDKLVYLDPDIVVLDKLQELETLLETHSVVVTPHLEEPESSLAAILDNEICALKHGVFNLGFLALRNTAEGRRFARWWCERSIHFCYDDIPNGLFTDQRWIDLAPGFFPDFYVLRDKSYNIATWNLSHRRVEKLADGRLCVAGAPIQFFHFSGFDSGAQLAMLNKYGAHSPALFELRDWYIAELDRAGQNEFGNLPWSFDCFSNGKVIRPEYRNLYREREDLRQAFPRPARVEEGKSYYHWCAENFRNGQPHRQKPPLLKKWKRSIMKRIPLVQSAIRKNGS